MCKTSALLQSAHKTLTFEAGEVVSLTYPNFTAWSAKPFRVLSVQDDGQTGNVLITCAEYVASLYDDSQIPVAVPVNPNPAITTDDVYNLILEDIGAFNADGTWVPNHKGELAESSGLYAERNICKVSATTAMQIGYWL